MKKDKETKDKWIYPKDKRRRMQKKCSRQDKFSISLC